MAMETLKMGWGVLQVRVEAYGQGHVGRLALLVLYLFCGQRTSLFNTDKSVTFHEYYIH